MNGEIIVIKTEDQRFSGLPIENKLLQQLRTKAFSPDINSVCQEEGEKKERGIRMFLEFLLEKRLIVIDGEKIFHFAGTWAKMEYFAPRFNSFKECVKALTLKEFSEEETPGISPIYDLITDLIERYEYYVYIEGSDNLITLDEFIRTAENGTQYVIEGVFGYHA